MMAPVVVNQPLAASDGSEGAGFLISVHPRVPSAAAC